MSQVVVGWQLEMIKEEGTDCQTIFVDNIPIEYMTNESGHTRPTLHH